MAVKSETTISQFDDLPREYPYLGKFKLSNSNCFVFHEEERHSYLVF